MAPLILHNVPDDELYIGDDGVQRPYAMVFPQQDGLPGSTRSRRTVTETGSFGKSTRRSRSRTGTPARRENPTLAAADRVFGDWISSQASAPASTATTPQRKSTLTASISQPNLLQDDTTTTPRLIKSEPEEVILRGYRSSAQQYAAINHYEELAGRICEDYSREPPVEQRRYKSDLRDPALTRRKALTAEERAKVSRADGGEHWVKVTFESAEAADTAMFASPQRILGHWVYCEPYHGMPPSKDEAVPDVELLEEQARSRSVSAGGHTPKGGRNTRTASALPASHTTPAFPSWGRLADLSPPSSHASSQTISTGTLATGSSVTVTATPAATGSEAAPLVQDSIFCQRIPTARKAKLLPADQALLPQLSYTQRVLNKVPFLKWFSGSMIGNEVPRTEMGDFDWNKASLYWKVIWWLDSTFGLFGGEILSADKDD